MKIVVVVEGGAVQSVMADAPGEVVVLDYDVSDLDSAVLIPQQGAEVGSVDLHVAEVDPGWVDQVWEIARRVTT